MEGKINRTVFKEPEEEPRHTRLADLYKQRSGALFQGWGPKL
jgi:hypothetical protein